MSGRPPAASKTPTKYIDDLSRGANLSTARQAVADNDAWWMEGMIPVAPGNLTITNGPRVTEIGAWRAAISGETGAPTFAYTFNVAGLDYIFVVWSNSGNGYIGDVVGSSVTKFFSGTLTSGTTAAAQWNNKGLLIVDPIGYWDWNITGAGALTALNNSVQSITVTDGGSGYTSTPSAALSGGGGSGAAVQAYTGLGSIAAITTAGTNYKVGDVISVNLNLTTAFGKITVTTVNATGGITGVSVTAPGAGIGAISTTLTDGSNMFGGAGSGAVFTAVYVVSQILVVTRGTGYTSAPAVAITGGGSPTRNAAASAQVSGSLGGTAIAVYAGRAWIASGRAVTFSDAGSFASFVGSGSSFPIQDDYLHANITALHAANNYLYIFGVDSVDVLSNVTISAAGTANFSRVNVSASIGCSQPNSIFDYYRAVAFANQTGFYLLSGASPEKISDALDLLVPQINYSATFLVYGGQVTVAGILCAAWSITFNDIFYSAGASKTMLVVYFRGRWFFARQAVTGTPLTLGPIVSVAPVVGATNYTLYSFDSTQNIYQLFNLATGTYWRLSTKLYDCEKPLWTKQAIKSAMGVQMLGIQSSRAGIAFTVDTEVHGTGQATSLPAGTFSGYTRFMGSNSEAGGQFMGLGVAGNGATQADVTRIEWLAFQYAEMTEWAA